MYVLKIENILELIKCTLAIDLRINNNIKIKQNKSKYLSSNTLVGFYVFIVGMPNILFVRFYIFRSINDQLSLNK